MNPQYAARIRECEAAIRTINGQINDNNRERSRCSQMQDRLSHAINCLYPHENSLYDLNNHLWLDKNGGDSGSWKGQKKNETNNVVSGRLRPITGNHARFTSDILHQLNDERKRLENAKYEADRSINALSRNKYNLEREIERLKSL